MSMQPLSGKVIGLLESRQRDALAAMVTRLGGTPVCAPSVREVPSVDDVEQVLDRIAVGHFSTIVVLTGAALTTLFHEAESRRRLDELRQALSTRRLVVRGPKPQTVLRRHGLVADAMTGKPHTTDDLLDVLSLLPIDGETILLLQYGERNLTVSEALAKRGATVEDACLYEWALPEDTAPMVALIEQTLAGKIDALAFTTQIQFRHLLAVAGTMAVSERLLDVLRDTVVVAAVGPVCARALRGEKVTPDVMPGAPNSASLIAAVGEYFDMTRRAGEALSACPSP